MKTKKSNLWNRILLAFISVNYTMGYPVDYEAARESMAYFKEAL